jgi:hypothetical protein
MSNDKEKSVVDFTGKQVDPEYQARIEAAKQHKVPVGGAPMPQMPRLDSSPVERGVGTHTAASLQRILGRTLTAEEQQRLEAEGKMIPGVGSAYAANQPAVASAGSTKTVQEGDFVNPPRPPGSGLRPETAQQVAAVMQANATKTDEDLKKASQEIEEIDDQYETNEFGERIRSLLANKERREAIEKRCKPLDITDFISLGEVRQDVPIIPGKYTPTFRSISGDEGLFIKQLMSKERGSDQFIMDKFAMLNLTAGLFAFNGTPFPTHLKGDEPNEELFLAKFKRVSKLPFAILTDLSQNYLWFTRRVDKLLVIDNIKGF